MARHERVDKEELQVWKIAANLLNGSFGVPIRGSPLYWGLGRGLNTPYRKKTTCDIFYSSSDVDGFFKMV